MSASSFRRLAPITSEQWGLVTRRQAERAGVPPATLQRMAGDQGVLERVAHGVYRLTGAPLPDHLDLRAAWLQLAPEVPAWERTPDQGIVSHRSAAALYGLGHLPADIHDFTLSARHQSRRPDVRIHQRLVDGVGHTIRAGLPVARPARIASDLMRDREDPGAIAQVIVEALNAGYEDAPSFIDELSPHASHFGLRRGDGRALLRWLLDLAGDTGGADVISRLA